MTYTEIANIADKIIASLLTLIFVFIYNKYIKKIWKAKNKKDAKIKARLVFSARYFAIAMTVLLLWIFFPLNKFFVFIMSVIFSMFIIVIIYDYSVYSLKGVLSDREKEEQQRNCKKLVTSLINTNNDDKIKKERIFKSLKKLDCEVNWADIEKDLIT